MRFIEKTIAQQFKNVAVKKHDKVSLIYRDQKYTWEDIDVISARIASDLLKLSVRKGSRIAIWCKNSPLYLSSLLAIVRIGCTAVLVNPSYKTYEMNQLVKYADLQGMYCDENTVSKLEYVAGMRFLNYVGNDSMERILAKEPLTAAEKERLYQRETEVDPYDFACMLFTSGTTGGPKGVELTHFQLLNIARRAVRAMRWNEKDVVCLSLPLFHSFGLSTGFLASLFHEGTVCLNDSYHSADVLKCIEKNKCTVLNGVPTMFLSLLNNPERKERNIESLQSGVIAGSGVYESDFLKISKELDIPHLMQSYGQTEASPSITFSDYDDPVEKRAKSVGRVIPDVEMRISGKGEIEIRGFNTMKGYFNKNAVTERILAKDGWMKTGDIGYIDTEGNLHISGREKEMIIRGGENISPVEIEEVLIRMEGIRQVKVFGIKEAVIQENIAACIVAEHPMEREKIRSFVRSYLADYKVPKYICFYAEFPETASGKVDVQKLTAQALSDIKHQENL